ncbi:radical SAM protein, partial [Klebsiella pneumoniae]|nr:radical SAM protein [Klebsiella pneumoniae]
ESLVVTDSSPEALAGKIDQDKILEMLEDLNRVKPVWVELGLQTIHEKTAEKIHRGYKLETFEKAYRELKARNLAVIVHLILGLPGETGEDM